MKEVLLSIGRNICGIICGVICGNICGILFVKFKMKVEEKEELKHALENPENRQLFNEFVSRAGGSIKLFKSTLDAYNYCNEHPAVQYFTDKEKELSEHPEWFAKTMKTFVMRDSFYKKSYRKIILDAIVEGDNERMGNV